MSAIPPATIDRLKADRIVDRLNAMEFVRILLNGPALQNKNGLVEGSRASPFVEWYSRQDIRKDSGGLVPQPC